MTIPSELLGVIDSRVLAFTQQPFAMGTLLSRDSSGAGGLASFDGDETGVPVKVLATVHVFPPDRVLMVRVIGSGLRQPDLDDTRKPSPGEWVVVGGFTRNTFRVSTRGVLDIAGITNAGSSFTTVDGVAPLAITKRYDETNLQVGFGLDILANSGPNLRCEYGARLNATDYSLGLIHTTSAQHAGRMGVRDIPSLPAGDYIATARFRQDTAGPIGGNNADAYSFWVEEVVS
jgi:hypothetical protein